MLSPTQRLAMSACEIRKAECDRPFSARVDGMPALHDAPNEIR
jgi:hypothetical protein